VSDRASSLRVFVDDTRRRINEYTLGVKVTKSPDTPSWTGVVSQTPNTKRNTKNLTASGKTDESSQAPQSSESLESVDLQERGNEIE